MRIYFDLYSCFSRFLFFCSKRPRLWCLHSRIWGRSSRMAFLPCAFLISLRSFLMWPVMGRVRYQIRPSIWETVWRHLSGCITIYCEHFSSSWFPLAPTSRRTSQLRNRSRCSLDSSAPVSRSPTFSWNQVMRWATCRAAQRRGSCRCPSRRALLLPHRLHRDSRKSKRRAIRAHYRSANCWSCRRTRSACNRRPETRWKRRCWCFCSILSVCSLVVEWVRARRCVESSPSSWTRCKRCCTGWLLHDNNPHASLMILKRSIPVYLLSPIRFRSPIDELFVVSDQQRFYRFILMFSI